MPPKRLRPIFYPIASVLVTAIVVASLTLAVTSVLENVRYLTFNAKILAFVGMARTVASSQKTFALNPGDNMWDALTSAGQILSPDDKVNSWNGPIRATSVGDNAVRVETDLPARDCRRTAWYFLEHPADLGVRTIEAQSQFERAWHPIYPGQDIKHAHVVEAACGKQANARIGLIFRIR